MESITIEPVSSSPCVNNMTMSYSTNPNNYNRTISDQKSNQWKSCCFTINTSATKYFVQVSILTSLIVYSAVMLVVIPECNSQRNYSSLLLFCLGILTPSPKMS